MHCTFFPIITYLSDQIGVRAYGSAIAALKAYPHKLTISTKISELPGCGPKVASLYKEYVRTNTVSEYTHLQNSSEFQTLKLFWGVWGCGAHTARNWYFGKGWRSLDDVIEQGWDTISRVQQIGIKYWEEFNEHKISRSEVEEIGRIVGEASQEVARGTVYEICGGYNPPSIPLILGTEEGNRLQGMWILYYQIQDLMLRRTFVLVWLKFWKKRG